MGNFLDRLRGQGQGQESSGSSLKPNKKPKGADRFSNWGSNSSTGNQSSTSQSESSTNITTSVTVGSDNEYMGSARGVVKDRPVIVGTTEFRPLYFHEKIVTDASINNENLSNTLDNIEKTDAGILFSIQSHIRVVLQDIIFSLFKSRVDYDIEDIMKKLSFSQEKNAILDGFAFSVPDNIVFYNVDVVNHIESKDANLAIELRELGEDKYLNLIFTYFLCSINSDKIFSDFKTSLTLATVTSETSMISEGDPGVPAVPPTIEKGTLYERFQATPAGNANLDVLSQFMLALSVLAGNNERYPDVSMSVASYRNAAGKRPAALGFKYNAGSSIAHMKHDIVHLHRLLHYLYLSCLGIPHYATINDQDEDLRDENFMVSVTHADGLTDNEITFIKTQKLRLANLIEKVCPHVFITANNTADVPGLIDTQALEAIIAESYDYFADENTPVHSYGLSGVSAIPDSLIATKSELSAGASMLDMGFYDALDSFSRMFSVLVKDISNSFNYPNSEISTIHDRSVGFIDSGVFRAYNRQLLQNYSHARNVSTDEEGGLRDGEDFLDYMLKEKYTSRDPKDFYSITSSGALDTALGKLAFLKNDTDFNISQIKPGAIGLVAHEYHKKHYDNVGNSGKYVSLEDLINAEESGSPGLVDTAAEKLKNQSNEIRSNFINDFSLHGLNNFIDENSEYFPIDYGEQLCEYFADRFENFNTTNCNSGSWAGNLLMSMFSDPEEIWMLFIVAYVAHVHGYELFQSVISDNSDRSLPSEFQILFGQELKTKDGGPGNLNKVQFGAAAQMYAIVRASVGKSGEPGDLDLDVDWSSSVDFNSTMNDYINSMAKTVVRGAYDAQQDNQTVISTLGDVCFRTFLKRLPMYTSSCPLEDYFVRGRYVGGELNSRKSLSSKASIQKVFLRTNQAANSTEKKIKFYGNPNFHKSRKDEGGTVTTLSDGATAWSDGTLASVLATSTFISELQEVADSYSTQTTDTAKDARSGLSIAKYAVENCISELKNSAGLNTKIDDQNTVGNTKGSDDEVRSYAGTRDRESIFAIKDYAEIFFEGVSSKLVNAAFAHEFDFLKNNGDTSRLVGPELENVNYHGIGSYSLQRCFINFCLMSLICKEINFCAISAPDTYDNNDGQWDSDEFEDNKFIKIWNKEIANGLVDGLRGAGNKYVNNPEKIRQDALQYFSYLPTTNIDFGSATVANIIQQLKAGTDISDVAANTNEAVGALNEIIASIEEFSKRHLGGYLLGYRRGVAVRDSVVGERSTLRKTTLESLSYARGIEGIGKIYDNLPNYTPGVPGVPSEPPAYETTITTTLGPDVFDSLIEKQTNIQFMNYPIYKRKLLRQGIENFYLPSSKDISEKQIRAALRHFGQDGKGYKMSVSKSGQRGGKFIMHVGLPAKMLEHIYGFPDTELNTSARIIKDGNTLVRIMIYRKNLIENRYEIYKKSFIFDMLTYYFNNSQVPDDVIDKDLLEKFSDIDVDSQFKEKHVLVRSDRFTEIDGSIEFNSIGALDMSQMSPSDITSITSEPSLAENHLDDYYLKLYTRVMSGLDFEEDVFQVSDYDEVSLFAGADSEPFTGEKDYADLFGSAVDEIIESKNLSPDQIDMIKRNKFRIQTEAKRSVFFAPFKYFYRVCRTKIFDRVFSLLVDETDQNFTPIDLDEINIHELVSNEYEIKSRFKEANNIDVMQGSLYQYFVKVSTSNSLFPGSSEQSEGSSGTESDSELSQLSQMIDGVKNIPDQTLARIRDTSNGMIPEISYNSDIKKSFE